MHIANARRAAGAHFVIVAGVLMASAGCSTYDIQIVCEKQINAYGLPDDQPGYVLDVVVMCLSEADLKSIAEGELPEWGKVEEYQLRQLVTADKWFNGRLRETLGLRSGTLATETLRDADQLIGAKAIKLKHPSPLGSKSCVVALAKFSNRKAAEDAKEGHVFKAEDMIFTAWKSHKMTLHVGKTTIRLSEER